MDETQIKVLSGKITALEIQLRYDLAPKKLIKETAEMFLIDTPLDSLPDDLLKRVKKLLEIDTTQQT